MTNLVFYGMYDYSSDDGAEYEYTSTEWTSLIKALSGTGIAINDRDKFAPSASGLDITIGSGMCFIQGRYGYNDSPTTLTLDAESVSLQRIDRIVLAADTINRVIGIDMKKGTASSNPTAPALTQTELYYEIPICQVRISGGSSTTITDERSFIYTPTEINEKLNRILNGTDFVYAVYA
jgi:hypothetical protein